MSNETLKKEALEYHLNPKPGKIAIEITKPTETQKDLSLAYTPGVAEPVKEIERDPENAYKYTAKGNLVGVITDGTAVLGLGNTGALASKPVMEGKGVLFKRFADIDVFDIEVNSDSIEDFCKTVENISPTFGGINLEDIKAPECFEIERILEEKLDIPVFHDDQHGTAIIIAAGLINALELKGKELKDARIVCLGAGAAGIASMKVLTSLGADKSKLYMLDRGGVIHSGRDDLNKYKQEWALETEDRTLLDACTGADVFIGLSGPNLLSVEALKAMADNPIVFALSNPDPEIDPEVAREARPDIIMATGRSDYPNQINNVLGFPYIFRGALDVRATNINTEMKMAAVHALASIAKEPVPDSVLKAYNKESMEFGPEYIIPTPLDPRLADILPAAISKAAIDSGVAKIK
ncbi:malic enzyme-like NAD(P)-binding protein [uncultured Cocleimonas sp.]|uniref:malic enzyme-like NAD(P)-binding protein n=1 Tax=uncultured Cocleimonas sp. TaxID=1051587 RepID=UPI0026323310|nr:malic enzyme-like NAD(P)-binding protein [uncultured Cocleimonas sp.]